MKIILASQSPRRQELLAMITPNFTVMASDADESIPPGTLPEEAVKTLARRKAAAVLAALRIERQNAPEGVCVVGADTIVVIDREILGKPHSRAECAAMLARLSGREHLVYTGVAALTSASGEERVFCEATPVEFYPLTPGEIAWYASTDEPYDKAGGYGIQGLGAVLVKGIRGDFFNVMGLPVARVYRVLKELGAFDR